MGGIVGERSGAYRGPVSPSCPDPTAQKAALRRQLLAARRQRPPIELISAANALSEVVLGQPELAASRVVAAYVSVGGEPGTGPLLDELRERDVRVLLPVLQRDDDLDWAPYAGAESLVSSRLGLLQPTTAPLGPDAVATADAVLCPALAVDTHGNRLGRGGGSYDRALRRVPYGRFVCALVYDDEWLPCVPADRHDVPVAAAATPSGLRRCGPH
jgi:5-formyltetrahydrofolate cyclo-ligase